MEDLLDFTKNHDEAYLEFLCRHDGGKIPDRAEMARGLKDEGIIRDASEITKMAGRNTDPITRQVMLSKMDYVSYYKKIKRSEPEMGCAVSDSGLDGRIILHLQESGISRLYKFQQDAIEAITRGGNVVIEAPTASGKTEAFVLPVIHLLKKDAGATALFVYPTKSLARDQHPKIAAMAEKLGMDAGVFDGDTGQADRQKILDDPPQILITNFDILHYHLWHRTRFASLLGRTRFLIVDETHVYSGIFGSNVFYIIKRLKRIARRIRFVASSATLDNAKEFCEELFGCEMELISGSGKKSETDFVMLFPSLRTQRALMVDLAKKLTAGGHKTMVFSNSHLNSELFSMQARKRGIRVRVHRAGLTAAYRRSVERAFKDGAIDAISCTPTLELGMDIGGVDGVISSIVPVTRLVQRMGRASRKGQKGYAFLALGNDPISQYYKNHPDDYFEDTEKIYIDPKNPFVEEFQVLAMACDAPIPHGELGGHDTAIQKHVSDGNLVLRQGRYVPDLIRAGALLRDYSIRGIGNSVDIFLDRKKVGERILPIALEELHKDAIYFLAGSRYRVKKFDYPGLRAHLSRIPRDYPYYTKALTEEWPTIERVIEQRTAFGVELAFCRLHIRKSVHGYANIALGQEAAQGSRVSLELPLEYDFVTKGLVFHAPQPADEMLRSKDAEYVEASGYHAAEHVVIEGSNMITGGVSQDLGGISMGTSGVIFVYDGAIGGSGASKALYDRFENAIGRSLSIVRECPCRGEAGCPRCTFSYRCGNNNEFLHKASAIEVFARIAGGENTVLVDHAGNRPIV